MAAPNPQNYPNIFADMESQNFDIYQNMPSNAIYDATMTSNVINRPNMCLAYPRSNSTSYNK